MTTIGQFSLNTFAVEFVQVHRAGTAPKVGKRRDGVAAAELATEHVGV